MVCAACSGPGMSVGDKSASLTRATAGGAGSTPGRSISSAGRSSQAIAGCPAASLGGRTAAATGEPARLQAKRLLSTQLIPPVLSLFTRFRPSRPFSPRFLSFAARFHRLAEAVPTSPKPDPRAKKKALPPSFDTADANQRINWRCSHRSMAGAGFSRSRRTPRWATPRSALT